MCISHMLLSVNMLQGPKVIDDLSSLWSKLNIIYTLKIYHVLIYILPQTPNTMWGIMSVIVW